MSKKIKLVINPVAGRGKTREKWPDYEKRFNKILGNFSWQFTEQRKHATKITRRALLEGFETIVAVGGDGTINEVVNGFFDNDKQINPEASLGVISMGTGGDWVRTLGVSNDIEKAAIKINKDETRKCDLGWLKCQSLEGKPVSRYFINSTDAGFGGTLIHQSNQSTKVFGAFWAYLIALLKTLMIHENACIEIKVDDSFSKELIVKSVVLANGQYFGGGMWIAPEAKPDDGMFEVVILGDLNRLETLANIHKLYKGTLSEHPKVETLQGKKVFLRSEAEVLIEADGELPGKLPASFEILPSVLNVIC